MPRTEKYFIGPKLLGDIREAITRVAGMPDRTSGVSLPVRLQELQRPGAARLRRGTFTHAVWAIGSTVEVTIQGETNTVSVTNYCIPVSGNSAATQALNVIYGSVMGTMTAVEIQQATNTCTSVIGGLDVTLLPGFDGSVIQLLGHAAGDTASTACLGLQWYSVTQCGTATAS